jgi:dCTP diphosphatase
VTRALNDIQSEVRQFRDEREWEKFHDPASLAAAINVEAGELLELFLWKDAGESLEFARGNTDRVSDELADIMIFTINLANRLDIDLEAAIEAKMALNAKRFPTDGHGDSPPSRKDLTES